MNEVYCRSWYAYIGKSITRQFLVRPIRVNKEKQTVVYIEFMDKYCYIRENTIEEFLKNYAHWDNCIFIDYLEQDVELALFGAVELIADKQTIIDKLYEERTELKMKTIELEIENKKLKKMSHTVLCSINPV